MYLQFFHRPSIAFQCPPNAKNQENAPLDYATAPRGWYRPRWETLLDDQYRVKDVHKKFWRKHQKIYPFYFRTIVKEISLISVV